MNTKNTKPKGSGNLAAYLAYRSATAHRQAENLAMIHRVARGSGVES